MVHVSISTYDGPLDLLLQLITRAKIDIKDIFLSEITDKYLQIVRSMDVLDMESASEFLTMAATLLQIKSRSLLPKPEEDIDVEEEKRRIIQNLYDYQRIKTASENLMQMAEAANRHYYKLPHEYAFSESEVVLEKVSVDELVLVFEELLKNRAFDEYVRRPVEMVRARSIPMEEKVAEIRNRLRTAHSLFFRELVVAGGVEELVVSFLAILELIFAGEIIARQNDAFGDILIETKDLQEG